MHIEGFARSCARWLLALVLGGCGGADPPPPDAGDPPPVIGPWSCTQDLSCVEYAWLPRWEFLRESRECRRWAAARCAPQGPNGDPFAGRCNLARDTRYPSPRSQVLYNERLREPGRAGCFSGDWEETY